MENVTFVLFDGFSNMVLSCLLEPLRAVRDQAQVQLGWRVVTPDNAPARSSSGLSISPDLAAEDTGACDLLIVLSGYGYREHAEEAGTALVRRLARQSRAVLGADTGAWIMARAGLLEGLPATIHWAAMSDFSEEFVNVRPRHDRYVKTGRMWSCGGASTALDFMLSFIEDRFGPANAFLASTMFLHDSETASAHSHGAARLTGKGTRKLRQAVNLMVETVETPLPLSELAEQAGLSLRSLDRLFKAELGMPPGRYYQLIRLSHARELANGSEFDLREIALRCGYGDASALSKAFRRTFGQPIRKTRGRRPR